MVADVAIWVRKEAPIRIALAPTERLKETSDKTFVSVATDAANRKNNQEAELLSLFLQFN